MIAIAFAALLQTALPVAEPPLDEGEPHAIVATLDVVDPFAAIAPMSEEAMREASGGSAAYAIGAVQTNTALTDIDLNGTATDTVSGEVAGNVISGNSGITTVFINTGNNVVLQSSVQVNVYTPAGQ